MNEARKVKVEGGTLKFNAAHFITFGGESERLHGHNYTLSIEMVGSLNEDRLVFDFSIIKKLAREICDRLDHHFILPLGNPHLRVRELSDGWQIHFQQKRYIFPREDVIALTIDNSTAECLAEYVANELLAALSSYDISNIRSLTVGVAEAPTQIAYYSVVISSTGDC